MYFKRILRLLLVNEPLSAYAIQKEFSLNRLQRGSETESEEPYSQVHRELQKLSKLGYVKGTESEGEKTTKIDFHLKDLGLIRALLDEELKIDPDLISTVVKLYPHSLVPIFLSWQSFVNHGQAAAFLEITDGIFRGMREDLLGEIEPVEQEVRTKGHESPTDQLDDLPETVVTMFMIELGRRTSKPEIVALLREDKSLMESFVAVHENIRLDQMLRARATQENEFRAVEQLPSSDTSSLQPRLPKELYEALRLIEKSESQGKFRQRYRVGLIFEMLDQTILHAALQ